MSWRQRWPGLVADIKTAGVKRMAVETDPRQALLQSLTNVITHNLKGWVVPVGDKEYGVDYRVEPDKNSATLSLFDFETDEAVASLKIS
jgi:hypothetical protein